MRAHDQDAPAALHAKAAPTPRPMRVVYYSSSIQLEPVLALSVEMSRLVEFHLILEMSPESWSSALFDVRPQRLPSGVIPGDAALCEVVPAAIRARWQCNSSFNLVVHNFSRSLHPKTWRVSLQAARFVRSLRPDVLHLDNLSLRMAPALWLLRATPMVLTLHDPEPHSGEGNWRGNLTQRLTFPFVDRFLLLNQTTGPNFSVRFGIAPERVDYTHLGLHGMCKEWLQVPPQQEERTVLFFGRLSQYKGLDVFYEAAAIVARRLRGVRFIVAGRPFPGYVPPEPPRLSNEATVEIIDRYMHNRETAELFSRATVVACPYLDATQSGVVLTAFAFGKSVVATRVGGLPEYVHDGVTGLLVEPGDAVGLAAATIRLLEDSALRTRLATGIAREAAAALSWTRAAEKSVESYRRAIAGRI